MPSIACELARHAAALRGLAFDLVGEQAADDLVQDTVVEALRAPPRRPGPVGGWLAGIVRHLASRHRRAAGRRKAHEVRAARDAKVPPDGSVEDRELFQRLTAAVMALPEPYQSTVLRRYLRECSPQEIARESGVPLATVKTRLQRGLALLRQRLAREGADWRPALLGASGLDGLLPRVASAFTPTGVLVMGTGAKLGLGCVAVALLAALWWSFGSEPAASISTAASGSRVTAAAGPLTAAAASPAGNERQEVPAGAAATPLAEGRTLVRGRCVDEQGAPLPRCTVELIGRKLIEREGPDLRREYGEWLVAHPDRLFRDLTTASDDEGRFEFTFGFVPLAYQLRLHREHTSCLFRIGALQPGQERDVGDVILPASSELRCRIVDTTGAPVQALAHVSLQTKLDRLVERDPHGIISDSDGRFVAYVVEGSHEFWIEGRTIVEGKSLVVPAGGAPIECTVVVSAAEADQSISGTIVDVSGRPVAGARLGPGAAMQGHAISDAAGRFTVVRPDDHGPDQVIFIWATPGSPGDDYGEMLVRWGTHDLRLVAEMGATREVELSVVTASDGTPVTGFEVYNASSQRAVARETLDALGNHHEHGLVRLACTVKGPVTLQIVPDRWDLWSARVEMPAGTLPEHVEVRLPAARRRILRVQHQDGSAANGVRVEQIQPGASPVTLSSDAWPRESWQYSVALLLERSATDDRGEVALHGPSEGTLAVRIPGPPAMLLPEVRFDTPEPLVVVLAKGGRLEGKLGPPDLVRELGLAYGSWYGTLAPAQRKSAIGFRLQRGRDQDRECIPPVTAGMVMVTDDGSFAIDDVPPGTWTLMFGGADDTSRVSRDRPEPVRDVELRSGEVTRVSVDLPDRVTGESEGQIVINGVPAAGVDFTVDSRKPGERARAWGAGQQTDADGRFRVCMVPGIAGAYLWTKLYLPGRILRNVWRSSDEVPVQPGGKVSQVFHFERARLHVRVLGPDGTPRENVALLLRGDDVPLSQTTTTAADGWLTADTDVRSLTLQTLPRSIEWASGPISGWIVDRVLWRVPHEDPFAGQWLTLGRVTPKAGETVEMELRLPLEWDR